MSEGAEVDSVPEARGPSGDSRRHPETISSKDKPLAKNQPRIPVRSAERAEIMEASFNQGAKPSRRGMILSRTRRSLPKSKNRRTTAPQQRTPYNLSRGAKLNKSVEAVKAGGNRQL
ncbi:MAG: hypothetical protein KJ057_05985 [Phycisphaerae bacterium]|nr:hypothetical protein [Planctomycetia bacterium]MCK6464442.1 hypothetical protein [Phycisphaerae bacterium]MCL4718007.1 hypothetical protein [Phycisphaerae bacterium]NUQ07731.1 hypothetical protein [Phycisphaerae bacterium]